MFTKGVLKNENAARGELVELRTVACPVRVLRQAQDERAHIVTGSTLRWFGLGLLIALLAGFPAGAAASVDPQTLPQFIAEVEAMKARGASPDEIAAFVAGVVDRRLTSTNKFSVAGGDWFSLLWDAPQWFDRGFFSRSGRVMRERNTHSGNEPGVIRPSGSTEQAAWAWRERVGNCNEAMSVTHHVLTRAGIPAVMLEHAKGHDFTVIGMRPDADPNDPRTWGPDARVVDGWTGEILTPEQALRSKYHHGRPGSGDVSRCTYSDEMDRQWERMAGKGVVRVQVVRNDDGAGVDGVRVAAGPVASVTSNGGMTKLELPIGSYAVTLTPPVGSFLRAGSAGVRVRERRISEVRLALETDTGRSVPLVIVVQDEQSSRIAGAEVRVQPAAGGAARRGSGGRCEFSVLPGDYAVSATAAGYRQTGQSRARVAARPGEGGTAILVLAKEAEAEPPAPVVPPRAATSTANAASRYRFHYHIASVNDEYLSPTTHQWETRNLLTSGPITISGRFDHNPTVWEGVVRGRQVDAWTYHHRASIEGDRVVLGADYDYSSTNRTNYNWNDATRQREYYTFDSSFRLHQRYTLPVEFTIGDLSETLAITGSITGAQTGTWQTRYAADRLQFAISASTIAPAVNLSLGPDQNRVESDFTLTLNPVVSRAPDGSPMFKYQPSFQGTGLETATASRLNREWRQSSDLGLHLWDGFVASTPILQAGIETLWFAPDFSFRDSDRISIGRFRVTYVPVEAAVR